MARDKAANGQRVRRKNDKSKHTHINKYAHLAPKPKSTDYNSKDKTWRNLPVTGSPSQIVEAGTLVMFHSRLYILTKDVTIPKSGEPQIGRCKLKQFLDQCGV